MTSPTAFQAFKSFFGRVLRRLSPDLEHELRKYFSKSCWENWPYRSKLVGACPDNDHIPRSPNAGQIVEDFQIMHNGLKILVGSYYGKGLSDLLGKNRGVHEPQEERVFQEVLKQIPPGSVMIELGAYWAFYSMWFCQQVPRARAFMVEPEAANLIFGQKNFAANSLQGHFTRALVSRHSGQTPDGTRIICVDDLAAEQGLEQIAILHSDIQSFELDMLHGAEKTLPRIAYVFISTHTEELHHACEEFLRERQFLTLASISPRDSYSSDGILVCRAQNTPAIPRLDLARRTHDPRHR